LRDHDKTQSNLRNPEEVHRELPEGLKRDERSAWPKQGRGQE